MSVTCHAININHDPNHEPMCDPKNDDPKTYHPKKYDPNNADPNNDDPNHDHPKYRTDNKTLSQTYQ
eukprot:4200518-Amphidinium_carterae.1